MRAFSDIEKQIILGLVEIYNRRGLVLLTNIIDNPMKGRNTSINTNGEWGLRINANGELTAYVSANIEYPNIINDVYRTIRRTIVTVSELFDYLKSNRLIITIPMEERVAGQAKDIGHAFQLDQDYAKNHNGESSFGSSNFLKDIPSEIKKNFVKIIDEQIEYISPQLMQLVNNHFLDKEELKEKWTARRSWWSIIGTGILTISTIGASIISSCTTSDIKVVSPISTKITENVDIRAVMTSPLDVNVSGNINTKTKAKITSPVSANVSGCVHVSGATSPAIIVPCKCTSEPLPAQGVLKEDADDALERK